MGKTDTTTFSLIFHCKNLTYEILDVITGETGVSVNGIWETEVTNKSGIENLIENKIPVGVNINSLSEFPDIAINTVQELFQLQKSAKVQKDESLRKFNDYSKQNPKSKLISPNFFEWEKINPNKTFEENSRLLGKSFFAISKSQENCELMGTSRFLKYILENWLTDEKIRLSKYAVYGQSEMRYIPSIAMRVANYHA